MIVSWAVRAAILMARAIVLSAALAFGASWETRVQEPRVRAWGDSITLRPSGLRLRLPADGIRWEQQSGVSHGDTTYFLVGTLPEGSTLSLRIDSVPAQVMGRNVGSCGDYLDALKRGYAELGQRSGIRILSRQDWIPRGSGWSSHVIAIGRTTLTACHDGGRRPLMVDTTDDPTSPLLALAARTLLWLVGAAASRTAGTR
jgi:hypothetical protein